MTPFPPWLSGALRPFERRMVDVPGHRLHVLLTDGQGPAILLLHGNPTWSFLWRHVMRRLSGFRCVAPDLFGFGLSNKPASIDAHTVDAHVDAVFELVQALALTDVVVVGQDWGGPIGCGVAERLDRAGQLCGLVLANTAVLPPRRPVRATPFHRFANVPLVSDVAFRALHFPLPVLSRVQGDPSSIGSFERRAYRFPFLRWRDRAGPLALARMVPHRQAHPSLPALDRIGAWVTRYKGPVALVWGNRDPVLGRALRRLRDALPNASVTETEAGHFLQEEVPGPLADAIRSIS